MTKKIAPEPTAPGKGRVAGGSPRPELEGADSVLRCYNATTWRLEDWFADDRLPTPAPRREKSPPAPPRSPVVK